MSGDLEGLKSQFQSGASALQQGRFDEAIAVADRILAGRPGDYDASHLKLLAMLHGGRGATALPFAEGLAAAFPDDAPTHNSLGATLQVCGRLPDACAAFQRAVSLQPSFAEGWLNLARASLGAGRPGEAAAAFRKLLDLGHRNIHVLAGLGGALLQSGDQAAAVEAFGSAVKLDPANRALLADYGHVRDHLSAALLSQGRTAEVETITQETRRLGVAGERTLVHQTFARMQRSDYAAAVSSAREAMRLSPSSAEAHGLAGLAALEAGEDPSQALGLLGEARRLDPAAARWRFLEALAWPPILDSEAKAAVRASEMHRSLDELLAQPGVLKDPFREVGKTPFYMAYSGLDDTAAQRKIADAYRAACPSLEWRAPHVDRTGARGARRIRIGILSAHLTNHTIAKLNIGFVQELDRKRFEVVVLRPTGQGDTLSALVDQAADRVVTFPMELDAARRKVAEAELDALFYPDVGMDPFTYFLAFARLAPLQFTTWGHPVTTGIPNMDCFLSTRHAEPADAQRFYRERLVQFEHLPSFYHPPRPPSIMDVRAHLGIARDARIYACPQTLFKFHPSQDEALCGIPRRDPKGLVLLVKSRNEGWNRRLQARLARAGADVADRIRFIDPLPLPDFLALVRDADALLDTFVFGGGNSSYESFSMGRPVVTLPAAMMRGRITAAWYSVMQDDEWVARSPDDYVERAVRLANDEDAKRAARARIAERAPRLLGNKGVVRELEAFVENALRG